MMHRFCAVATCAIVVVGSLLRPAAAQTISNPDLFGKSQRAAQQAVHYYGHYDNPEELSRMVEIGYRLAQESPFRDFPFTFYLVDMPEPNAFALPGGQVFLTRGMLDMGLNDDMLAGLLGHEIGHVILKHGTRLQKKATLLNVLTQALLVGVIISASGNDSRAPTHPYDPYGSSSSKGDLIQGTAAAGAVIGELLMRSYSREFEDEADEEGQRLAAVAGFDPDGTRQLMSKMKTYLPQSREYGYWRTHPFFEERVLAATAREKFLKSQPPESADAYRARTQATLLSYVEKQVVDPPVAQLIKQEALLAWPVGPAADAIRLEQLHDARDAELEKKTLSQDLGQLTRNYERHLGEVQELAPDSPLIATLEEEMEGFRGRQQELYPQAQKVLEAGIYETEFLETFLSNYPDAPEVLQVSLALGEAYSRLGRQSDAVRHYLAAWERAPESQQGQRAREGLRRLAPRLNQLSALEQLTAVSDDSDLQRSATERLTQLASEYEDMADGADYLRRFPEGQHAQTVATRLNELADELYGELILYQTVGDHVKGIERIQKILTYAPQSPAAERLRDRMVLG